MLDQLFTRLEADMRQALPRAARTGGGSEPAWVGTTTADGNGELRFSRAGTEFALEPGSAGPAHRVPLPRRRDRGRCTGPISTSRRAATPARRTCWPSGIARFRVDYLDPGGGWRDAMAACGRSAAAAGRARAAELASGETVERWLTLR